MIMNTGTLTVQGITWAYLRYNGKLAFRYGAHAIVFDINSGYYQIKELGETVFVSRSVTECLENAAEYVWEYHAAQFVPSWESPSATTLEYLSQHISPAWETAPIHGDLNASIDGCNQAA